MTKIDIAPTPPTHPSRPSRNRPPSRLRRLVAEHPLTSFFTLALGLSWLAWIPYILSANGTGVWAFRFPEVLGTSQLTGMLPGAYLGPIFAAFLVTAVADGRPGLRRWAARLWHWRVRWTWYVGALLGVPAAMVLVGLVASGGQISAPPLLALAAFVPGLVLQMLTTGLAEEPGWRDFALPRLQDRFGPLGATAVLGPLWAVWHLPLFLTEWGGWPDVSVGDVLGFVAFCLSFNVVMSWVFNRTGQSLPVAMLTHVSVNNFMSVLWTDLFPPAATEQAMTFLAAGATVVAVVLLVATRGRLGFAATTPSLAATPAADRS